MEWIWGCMVLSFKASFGAACWLFGLSIFAGMIGTIVALIEREF